MSSQYLRALQPSFAGEQPLFAAQDAIAADLIEKAADSGNDAAAEFAAELNGSLGRAYVRRARKRRLLRKARKASMQGHHDLAELAGLVASEEETEAMGEEAFAHSCVRGTHDAYGYLTGPEKAFMARKKSESSWTTKQAEGVLAQLLDRLYNMTASYGLEEDEFGAATEAQDAVHDLALDKAFTIADAFGGDAHLVFGDGVYEEMGAMFEVSQEKLRARRSRLMKRLTKLENKLEEMEESGKKFGLRIQQKRIEWLEKRISKLDGKIKKTKKGRRKVAKAEVESKQIKKAEASAVKETTEETPEISIDEVEDIESELEEFQEDEWGAEVDLFGMSERRKTRILRRLNRLEARLDKMEGRRQTAGRTRRITRVRNRIERLRNKLQTAPSDQSAISTSDSAYPTTTTDYLSAYTVQDPAGFSDQAYVDSFFAGSANSVEQADRQPFVAYFSRRSELMGAHPDDGFGVEGQDGGFFSRLGNFFKTVFVEPVQSFFTPAKREKRAERRGVRRDKVKAYMEARKERIDRTRAARKSARVEERTAPKRKEARKARRTRRVESRQAAKAAHKSAWESHTPQVKATRRQLKLARKNVRLAAKAARRNEKGPRRRQDAPVLLTGTEGWAQYTLDPSTQVIAYTHPGTGARPELRGQNLTIQPNTAPHTAIMQAVEFQPARATA
jgi:hypothetical protein